MSDTAPPQETPAPSARLIRRRHTTALALVVGLFALAVLLYGWSVYAKQRAALWWSLSSQAVQLQLALNDTLDVARSHVATMRQTTERNLRQPLLADNTLVDRLERRNLAPLRDAPWDRLPQELVKEVGSVHVDPNGDAMAYRRGVEAPMGALGQVSASHGQHQRLSSSYFYDAQKQWRWVYPAQPRDELLTATGKADMGAALAALWDAGGTTPLDAAGPARNPQKELVWTAAHTDPVKKTGVVSVLAPVYSGERYVGLVGADLTLEALHNVLVQRALPMGQAWVVNGQGQVITSGATKDAALPAGPYTPEAGWMRLALRGTDWSLLIHAPNGMLMRQTLQQMVPMLVTGVAAVLALLGACLWLAQRYTLPALQLAEYVQQTEGPAIKRPPPVPPIWKPWFDRVARAALQRRDQAVATHNRSTQLEHQALQHANDMRAAAAEHEAQMAARAGELRSAYAQLSAALADAQANPKKTTPPLLPD
ncbi:cache domain-containing protein [uncultured Rhodoferax sp.]|uniref:cache domain-containing protein n=1 Tax=uncultured Rhodoferax sp. TaxID=223188 RepID=UPI0025D8E990|nr:cache domain-containing protein [uncultured Rhodoferax sp.]